MTDVRFTVFEGVATVVIDRAPVNALTIDSYRQITSIFDALDRREDIRCVIFKGQGRRAFCAGFDFKHFAQAGGEEDDPKRPDILRGMFEAVRTCGIPVIGAINGAAIGAGCVLAAVCDIRIAADHATFGLPEIDFGRVGGAAYLAPLISPGLLRRMAFTGRPVPAAEALRAGLVDEVVAADRLDQVAADFATLIAGKSGPALRHVKAALNAIELRPVVDAYRIEQEYSVRLRAVMEGPAE